MRKVVGSSPTAASKALQTGTFLSVAHARCQKRASAQRRAGRLRVVRLGSRPRHDHAAVLPRSRGVATPGSAGRRGRFWVEAVAGPSGARVASCDGGDDEQDERGEGGAGTDDVACPLASVSGVGGDRRGSGSLLVLSAGAEWGRDRSRSRRGRRGSRPRRVRRACGAVPLALTARPMADMSATRSSAGWSWSIRRSVYAKSARNCASSAARQAGARSQAIGMTPARNSAPLISITIDHTSVMTASFPYAAGGDAARPPWARRRATVLRRRRSRAACDPGPGRL
jgi:hypothetical protein